MVLNDGIAAPGLAARAYAQKLLQHVLGRRRTLDAALEQMAAPVGLSARDLGFARAIASETLRRMGQLDALLRQLVPKSPPPHRAGPTLEILLAGACELLFLGVPQHAAVDAANRLAAGDARAVHFKPLINACLRRIAREGGDLIAHQDAERLNTPDWVWDRWCAQFGEETTRAMARVHASVPPLDLALKSSDVPASLKPVGELLPGDMLRIRDTRVVGSLPGYAEGCWWVQDFAASLPVRLLGDVRGKTVIDLCAAPGGKTASLVCRGAQVVAVERDAERLSRLKSNLDRLGLSARFIHSDLRDLTSELRAEIVLLDAPCSATGTIRRHPELPWIKSAADVNACAETSRELLDAAAEMLEPGGLLLFSVCSLEGEECADQTGQFLHRHNNFHRRAVLSDEVLGVTQLLSPEGDLRTLPCHLADWGGMDGFYAARLERLG
jgi:16S rRNA (cytosine967-C5)-methyltransferase